MKIINVMLGIVGSILLLIMLFLVIALILFTVEQYKKNRAKTAEELDKELAIIRDRQRYKDKKPYSKRRQHNKRVPYLSKQHNNIMEDKDDTRKRKFRTKGGSKCIQY